MGSFFRKSISCTMEARKSDNDVDPVPQWKSKNRNKRLELLYMLDSTERPLRENASESETRNISPSQGLNRVETSQDSLQ